MPELTDSLEEAIGISIWTASVGWVEEDAGRVFDSERASEITEALIEFVRDYRAIRRTMEKKPRPITYKRPAGVENRRKKNKVAKATRKKNRG